MSGGTRGRYRFADWTLSAITGMAARYVGKCLACGARCADTAEADDAQVWCLKHAGATRHTGYEVSGFQYFNASMTGPGETQSSVPG
ncbi:hypothetical protein [Streptomyces sp. NPDC059009]|uniref:DUF7848 domain-containing protein n=1 Tax=Streptomyces sp. NPDC059009 TaxID=3346694 RepID=UPI003695B182